MMLMPQQQWCGPRPQEGVLCHSHSITEMLFQLCAKKANQRRHWQQQQKKLLALPPQPLAPQLVAVAAALQLVVHVLQPLCPCAMHLHSKIQPAASRALPRHQENAAALLFPGTRRSFCLCGAARHKRLLFICSVSSMLRSCRDAAIQGACWRATAVAVQAGLQVPAIQSERKRSYLALATLREQHAKGYSARNNGHSSTNSSIRHSCRWFLQLLSRFGPRIRTVQ